jgi:Cu(I)/Ag(I) efflux system membrane protein CusA/SilA
MIDRLVQICLRNPLVVFILLALMVGAGVLVAPFNWNLGWLPRSPVHVDAIPDIGENQQIVFTEWEGRSPQDIEDQITYPLTVALLGLPEVKTIRSFSMFGFSMVYVIFNESAEFYWTRSRILEKLNSLPQGTLPEGAAPALGPDATGLGQVFQYTIEGRDPQGNPTGGWDLHELRTVQDYYVRYSFQAVEGVSEVASIGGFVREYQIDLNPEAMRAFSVGLEDVFTAVRRSNIDVGARTMEINRVDYVIRGLGFIRSLDDLEKVTVAVRDNVPVTLRQISTVGRGPALRRGVLDKEGTEVVGGIVVARYGANPMAVIDEVKKQIVAITPGLPSKTLEDGTISRLEIVPFYDRSGLILETLGTLNSAIQQQIFITVIVVILMVLHLRSALVISSMLPLTVLMTFIFMKLFGVDANIVALSGIAIAIGTIVDMGIVISENTLRHLEKHPAHGIPAVRETVSRSTREVGGAVFTAVATTVVSFLPVFFMEGAEGKLFKPLAFTKTFALIAAIVLALSILPTLLTWFLGASAPRRAGRWILTVLLLAGGVLLPLFLPWFPWMVGALMVLLGIFGQFRERFAPLHQKRLMWVFNFIVAILFALILADIWVPLGPEKGILNAVFVLGVSASLILLAHGFIHFYPRILRFFLDYKGALFACVALVIFAGLMVWLGFGKVFAWVPEGLRKNQVWNAAYHTFPGLGKEFMPSLDEGSFLYMPTIMPHGSIGEAAEVLSLQNQAIASIPEIDTVVGKIGRAESPLDPAPVSMIETVINYKPEYIVDDNGRRLRFRYDPRKAEFLRDEAGNLIPDTKGRPYRQWREEIRTPDDIWQEIVHIAEVPGVTSAPKLQPIETRIVMLQSGMRAAFGVKVYGPDLPTIEKVGLEIERHLREVPDIEPATVFADRIVGVPYLEIDIDRDALSRYGLTIADVQDVIEVAIGGTPITMTVEGRERYPVRIRYQRELRDSIEAIGRILIPTMDGVQIPLGQLARVNFSRGPEAIKAEDTFLVGYVIFDKKPGVAEVDVVENAASYLKDLISSGDLVLPAGVSYRFTGAYESQVRAEARLMLLVPLSIVLIFLLIYGQFNNVPRSLLVFSGIFIAWSGGFILLWFYNQPWFLDVSIAGIDLRQLFQIGPVNLSVAVWVGFLALFGIATDDGVLMTTYLSDTFNDLQPATKSRIRDAVVVGASMRVRPAMMTTATTVLALLPVITSTGRGSDVMVPMALPTVGGMTVAILTLLTTPVLFCLLEEIRLDSRKSHQTPDLKKSK